MRFLPLAVLVLLVGCTRTPTHEVTLPSGKRIRVIAVVQMYYTFYTPALILKYQTDLKLSDLPALRREVDEIWTAFRPDVEGARLTNAVISANEVPQGWIMQYGRGYNFVFRKVEGKWNNP